MPSHNKGTSKSQMLLAVAVLHYQTTGGSLGVTDDFSFTKYRGGVCAGDLHMQVRQPTLFSPARQVQRTLSGHPPMNHRMSTRPSRQVLHGRSVGPIVLVPSADTQRTCNKGCRPNRRKSHGTNAFIVAIQS